MSRLKRPHDSRQIAHPLHFRAVPLPSRSIMKANEGPAHGHFDNGVRSP